MKPVIPAIMVTMLLFILVLACAPVAPATAPVAPPPTRAPAESSSKGGWEAEWEKVVSAAQKEGELMVYASNVPPEARIAIIDAFDKKFGIKMNMLVAPSLQLITRINSEYRAGVYQVDVYLGGVSALTLQSKPLGYLSLLEPALILPEVKDPKVWHGGKLPFFDRDGTVIAWLAISSPGIIYNTGLVKKGDLESYLDLLKPEWKEKIIMQDPTMGGNAANGMQDLVEQWGLDKAREFLRYVVKEQLAVVTRDQRQGVEWVARGKVPIGLFASPASVIQFAKEGAPLASPLTKEAKRLSASNGGLAVLAKSPHPNATIVFVNWLLSREGQVVVAPVYGSPSARADVPAEGVPEIVRTMPGQKYVFQNEESSMKQTETEGEWKKVIGQ
ncbi:MAG: extracellular solute-binding protein [Chloroflexi bacterium]|nr:extracellular solute-binding protein [Chloroflexota bacterium]